MTPARERLARQYVYDMINSFIVDPHKGNAHMEYYYPSLSFYSPDIEIESPFPTLGYHDIQIGILRILFVQYGQWRLFALLHVINSIKDKACTKYFLICLHRYPFNQKATFDKIVTREFVFECLINVEYEVHFYFGIQSEFR